MTLCAKSNYIFRQLFLNFGVLTQLSSKSEVFTFEKDCQKGKIIYFFLWKSLDQFYSSLFKFYFMITGGYYFRIERIERLLQVLIWIFLPDTSERPQLGLPPQANVDFRAACFCHRQLVDVGFVCSVCLSIFCKFTPFCSTCNTVYSNRLVKKKKSK